MRNWKTWKTLALAVLVLMTTTACELRKVPAGHVGVKVHLLGNKKGPDVEEVGMGRYWLGINEDLYLFPTFTQNYTWTAGWDTDDGDEARDEQFVFQTVEGMEVSADVGISYRIDPKQVDTVFQKYRRGIDEITDTFLRNMVRDALVKHSSTREVEEIYGAGKTELMQLVQRDVTAEVADIGIIVEKIYWIGNIRIPAQVTRALNLKIEATQAAAQRENEVAKAKAEAAIAVAQAEGRAKSLIAEASAEAEAIRLQGEALRQNPQVLQLRQIEKWDGILPRFSGGGAVPFINVDPAQ